MILEVARIITDWFGDPTNGINALIPSTPRDSGDSAPPNLVDIVDITRNTEASLANVPAATPVLQLRVRMADRMEAQAAQGMAECVSDVYARVLINDSNVARATANQLYLLRAGLRSLRRLLLNESAAARTRNEVQMYHAEILELVEIQFDPRDPVLSFVIHAQVLARDLLPL